MSGRGYSMLVKRGPDEELEVCGYKTSVSRTVVTYFFIVITGGLLRLVFHWLPHWLLKATSIECPVTDAEKILITVSTI